MKKFIFSLEKVLDVKKIEEKTIQKQLLYIQAKIYEVEKSILLLIEKTSMEREKVSSLKDQKNSSHDIMVIYKYIESLAVEKEQLYLDLDNLKVTESTVRNKLVEKSKERKALEKLKDNKFDEYKRENKKDQQIIYDEIAITNHRLKHGATS